MSNTADTQKLIDQAVQDNLAKLFVPRWKPELAAQAAPKLSAAEQALDRAKADPYADRRAALASSQAAAVEARVAALEPTKRAVADLANNSAALEAEGVAAITALGQKKAEEALATGAANVQTIEAKGALDKLLADTVGAAMSQAGINMADHNNARSNLLGQLQSMQVKQQQLIAQRDQNNSGFTGGLVNALTRNENFAGRREQALLDQNDKDIKSTEDILSKLIGATSKLGALDQAVLGKQSAEMVAAAAEKAKAVAATAATTAEAVALNDANKLKIQTNQFELGLANQSRQIAIGETTAAKQGQLVDSQLEAAKLAKAGASATTAVNGTAIRSALVASGILDSQNQNVPPALRAYAANGKNVTSIVEAKILLDRHPEVVAKVDPTAIPTYRLWLSPSNGVLARPVFAALNASYQGKTEKEQLSRNSAISEVLNGVKLTSGQKAHEDGNIFASNFGAWLPPAGAGYASAVTDPQLKIAIDAVRKTNLGQALLARMGEAGNTELALQVTDQFVLDTAFGARNAFSANIKGIAGTQHEIAKQIAALYEVQAAVNNAVYSPDKLGLSKQSEYIIVADKKSGALGSVINNTSQYRVNLLDPQEVASMGLKIAIKNRNFDTVTGNPPK